MVKYIRQNLDFVTILYLFNRLCCSFLHFCLPKIKKTLNHCSHFTLLKVMLGNKGELLVQTCISSL